MVSDIIWNQFEKQRILKVFVNIMLMLPLLGRLPHTVGARAGTAAGHDHSAHVAVQGGGHAQLDVVVQVAAVVTGVHDDLP